MTTHKEMEEMGKETLYRTMWDYG